MIATNAVFTSTAYLDAPSRRHRIALRQVVSDPVARPAERLREALAFYADEDHWQPQHDDDGRPFVEVHDERGAKARRGRTAYYELAPLFASNAANDAALAVVEDAVDLYADAFNYVRDLTDDADDDPPVMCDRGTLAIRALAALERLVDEGARYSDDEEDR